MLGAVKFGHAAMQPVIDMIIDFAEDCAKELFDFQAPDYSDHMHAESGGRDRNARGFRAA